jgi:outer membrane protein OmpA-like peptidoglycan-associated protein
MLMTNPTRAAGDRPVTGVYRARKEIAKRVAWLTVLVAVLGGCATPGKKTAIGAGGGALGGAAIGAVAGGGKGAAIGALVGAVAGGAVGNHLDRQEQELRRVADARRTEDGILVNLKSSLLFSTDSAVLKPAAVEQLAALGDVLARYPDDRIRIQGHTDSTGSAAHNEALSLRRAEAVRDVLASRGVNPRQMLVEGAGASRSIADNSTPEGRAANRRVELHIDVPGRS